jgi:hypothetical protein
MRRVLWLVSFAVWLGLNGVGFAQAEPEEEAATDEATTPAPDEATAPAEGPEAKDEPAAPSGKAPQWFVGAYLQGVIVPSAFLDIWLAESPTVFNASFGATVTHRNADGFSWVLGIGYAGYGFAGPFRAEGDPELDTEYLDSSLGLLHVRGLLLWSIPIAQQFSFEYGVGLEFGAVLGQMTRTEAYLDANGEYRPCNGPGDPMDPHCELTENGQHTDPYDSMGAHYGVVEKRVPPVAGTLILPQLALRYAPTPELAIKLEASYELLQFTFGFSVAYGIDS